MNTGQRGRGRPTTGVKVQVRIPTDILAEIDDVARQANMTRAAVVRYMVDSWMARYRNSETVLPSNR
jgi:metal-responsive CopG/Arc/MetJ family transcriptional regulator